MRTRKITVLAFGADIVEGCRKAGKLGTARNYEKTVRSFATYIRSGAAGVRRADITFAGMTEEIIIGYENWLVSRGLVRNSSSFYMRNLRAIFNRAAEAGAAQHGSPFRKVYTGIDVTRKKAVGEEVVMRLQKLDLHRSKALSLARDIFVFSYCARGMAFVDVAFLRKEDISGDAFSYVRRKTGQRLTVAIEPCMELIIRRYSSITSDSPYVFPIIMSSDPAVAYSQYRIALNYHNRKLKRLASILGEPLNLSSYTARHTWATAARNNNVPLSVISASMGHTSEKTTRIYLAALDNSVIDLANRGIVGKLNGVGSA